MIVLVARDLAAADALMTALEERGATVELTSTREVARTARAVAPDVVAVLDEQGAEVRAALARDPLVCTVPVDDTPASDAGLHAAALVELASRGPERAGLGLAPAGDTLGARIGHALAPHASGVFSVRDSSRAGGVAVLPSPRQDALSALLERMRPLAARGERVTVSFLETTGGKLHSLPPAAPVARGMPDGTRIVLLSLSGANNDPLVERLALAGAEVVAVEAGGTGVGRARALAPDVILADEDVLDDPEAPALTALLSDPRLSWSTVVALPHTLLAGTVDARALARIEAAVHDAVAADHEITRLAERRDAFHVRLDATGPLRLLRALARARTHLRASVTAEAIQVDVELDDGLVVGAQARGAAGEVAQGHAALATLFTLPSGRVRVAPWSGTRSIDVMAPVEDAVRVAMRERPRIRSSWRPRTSDRPAVVAPASEVVAQLEARLSSRPDPPPPPTSEPVFAGPTPRPRERRSSPTPATVEHRSVDRDSSPPQPAFFSTASSPRPPKPVDDPSAPLDVAALEASALEAPALEASALEASAPSTQAAAPSLADRLEPAAPSAVSSPRPRASSSRAWAYVAILAGLALLVPVALRLRSPPPPSSAAIDARSLEAAFERAEAEAEVYAPAAAARAAERALQAAPPATTDTASAAPRPALDAATLEGMITRGNFARHRGALDLAARYYGDVVAADPANGRALAGLARVHQLRGDLPEATRWARVLLDAHPDHPANYVLLADLLIAAGDTLGARAILEDVTRRYPRNEAARARLDSLDR